MSRAVSFAVIRGQVQDDQAIVRLELLGAEGTSVVLDAVVDTGFNGFVSVPAQVVSQLQLRFAGIRRATLGGGTLVTFATFLGTVLWCDRRTDVLVSELHDVALIGMRLLMGSRLTVDVEHLGEVRISPLRNEFESRGS